MRSIVLIIVVLSSRLMVEDAHAQNVKRDRPEAWDALCFGGHYRPVTTIEHGRCSTRSKTIRTVSDAYALEETGQFVPLVRKHYPTVRIGDKEPYPCDSVQDMTAWIDDARARLRQIDVRGLGFRRLDVDESPDQIVIESWEGAPLSVVPETGEWTFTRSVRDLCRRFSKTQQTAK